MREPIIQTMVNKFLTWISKKSVTALYKQTHFWAFSWGLDEHTDLYLFSEESYHDRHRFGLHEETYERKTENSSEKPNNCEELNAYRKCVESRSFWDNKHCDGCYFDERCPFDEPKDEPTISKMEQVDKDINVRSKERSE